MADAGTIILTPEQAEALLCDGPTVHNYVNPSANVLVGVDFDRADAIAALHKALQIEIGGEHCKRMAHALVVWDSEKHFSFFASDADRVSAFEEDYAKARGETP